MSASHDPRFSIVVPTRERAQTLEFALRTCLAQRFDDYEIIVCDNCSSPATRQVVEGFGSPKIKYVRSEKPLAMSDNWDLAVSHAAGEYVTVIGDDDGLLPGTLSEADRLIRLLRVEVLQWDWIYYNWPGQSGLFPANRLRIPIPRQNRIMSSKSVVTAVAAGQAPVPLLPMIYNSLVHRELIQELRRKTGRVFKDFTPDVYSGFAFANLAKTYASVGRAMGINGRSPRSIGMAQFFGPKDNAIRGEFDSLNAAAGFQWHPRVPHVPKSMSAVVAETLERSNDNLFPNGGSLSFDRKALVEAIVGDLKQVGIPPSEEWRDAFAAIDAALAGDPDLRQWFTAEYSDWNSAWNSRDVGPRIHESYVVLDASDFGVSDVQGVAELLEKSLNWCGPRWWLEAQIHLLVLRSQGPVEFVRSFEFLTPIRRIRVALRDHGWQAAISALRQELSGSRVFDRDKLRAGSIGMD